ncbi:hypothetical protein GLAREA_05877 [Glarea lozoyensis ATCC 20868]|uniref:C2H2-type domain-containing protein n=1 Tax=Glarea lozoyensis (strain ATCC 20868 / MF5171) TaxID=1116229 RepID=S3D515_GLAL2|nr:uncharacterized protein GLAREA_05877 [Glarea lozoyensis ATCC 20868]EPE32865.1 hypothetical protein GLAREA_05877 [Glarea lozoyensis ATCC 20868]
MNNSFGSDSGLPQTMSWVDLDSATKDHNVDFSIYNSLDGSLTTQSSEISTNFYEDSGYADVEGCFSDILQNQTAPYERYFETVPETTSATGTSATTQYTELLSIASLSQPPSTPEARVYACDKPNCRYPLLKDKAGLTRHTREVHGSKDISRRFKCPLKSCTRNDKGFARRYNLTEHLRRCHGMDHDTIVTVKKGLKRIVDDHGVDYDKRLSSLDTSDGSRAEFDTTPQFTM